MCYISERHVKGGPKHPVSSHGALHVASEKAEDMLRPVGGTEVVAQAWLSKITSAHGETQREGFGETCIITPRRRLLLYGRPRVHHILHATLHALQNILTFGLLNSCRTSPSVNVGLHSYDFIFDPLAQFREK